MISVTVINKELRQCGIGSTAFEAATNAGIGEQFSKGILLVPDPKKIIGDIIMNEQGEPSWKWLPDYTLSLENRGYTEAQLKGFLTEEAARFYTFRGMLRIRGDELVCLMIIKKPGADAEKKN